MTAPILLDTCTAMWIMNNGAMKRSAEEAIDAASDRGQRIFISPITGWEVGMLASKGRFRSAYTPQKWLERLLSLPHIALASMPPELLMGSSFLPGKPPKDPWDRVIIATAREYGYVLVTRDQETLEYAKHGHLSVLEC